jgi:excisionase family DNA binding protein
MAEGPFAGGAFWMDDGSLYLSVQDAAHMLGVSARSVYGYLAKGQLSGTRIGERILVDAREILAFERQAPGRQRTLMPRWHTPPARNPLHLMLITLRLRAGCEELLEARLAEMRTVGQPCLDDISARSIGHNEDDPTEITVAIYWRGAVLSSTERRARAPAAFSAELAEALDWETASIKDFHIHLHAE